MAENSLSLFVVFINDVEIIIDEMHNFWVIDLFASNITKWIFEVWHVQFLWRFYWATSGKNIWNTAHTPSICHHYYRNITHSCTKNNPMTSRLVPESGLQHCMKCFHWKVSTILLDDPCWMYSVPFHCFNSSNHASTPWVSSNPSAMRNLCPLNKVKYFSCVCTNLGLMWHRWCCTKVVLQALFFRKLNYILEHKAPRYAFGTIPEHATKGNQLMWLEHVVQQTTQFGSLGALHPDIDSSSNSRQVFRSFSHWLLYDNRHSRKTSHGTSWDCSYKHCSSAQQYVAAAQNALK